MRNNQPSSLQNALTSDPNLMAPRLAGRATPAVLIVGLAALGAAAPALADDSIGAAKTVVNLVTGDLPTGANVDVFQGDDVFRDEGVRTDADSSARLVLRDNTNLLLGPSSSIKLDRFVYAGPSQPGAIAVNLVKGALRFATGDADKKAYVIATPTAALGVRGTVLKIVSTPSKTFVLLDEGGAIACTRIAAKRHCLQLTEPNQVVVVTATDVKWDTSGGAGVLAIFAAIPGPPGAPSGSSGGNNGASPPTTTTTTAITQPQSSDDDDSGKCTGGRRGHHWRKGEGGDDSGWGDKGWGDKGWSDKGWGDKGWGEKGWGDKGWRNSGQPGAGPNNSGRGSPG
jgi:hypothetical protein